MGVPQNTTAASLDRYQGIHSVSLPELRRLHHDVGLTIETIASRLGEDVEDVAVRMGEAGIDKLCDVCAEKVPPAGLSPSLNYCSERCESLDSGDDVVCPDCGETISEVGRWVAHRDRHGETRPILKKTNDYEPGGDRVKWKAQRGAALHRADRSCELCGARDGLDVHHLIKRRYFDHEERSHALENLIVLCRACHANEENASVRSTLRGALCE